MPYVVKNVVTGRYAMFDNLGGKIIYYTRPTFATIFYDKQEAEDYLLKYDLANCVVRYIKGV